MKRKKKVIQAPVPAHPMEYLLAQYRCVVRVFESELQLCRLDSNGERLFTRGGLGWEAVTHPVGEEFLEEVNRLMETRYTVRDFQRIVNDAKARHGSIYHSSLAVK